MESHLCKVCGGSNLHKIIDFGSIPNANEFEEKGVASKAKTYKLAFYWCADCTLFQQLDLAPPESLFNANYTYITSMNKPTIENFRQFAAKIGRQLKKKDFAVVVASNDGTEIQLLKNAGFKKVIGVDPSSNVAAIANKKGLFTIVDFFDEPLSKKIAKEYGQADLVVAKGVFAHIPDPRDMLAGMKNLINEDGRIMIEVHWLKSLVDKAEIDSLYAEHYYEFDMKAMRWLANGMGLKIVAAEYLPHMQGGEIRFILKTKGNEDAVKKFIDEEAKAGLYTLNGIKRLRTRAIKRKKKLNNLLLNLKAKNKKIGVWAVPAKVPQLFNFCGITDKLVDCAYEITDYKIGKIIPKTDIQIKDEHALRQDMPDYLILGAWNYIDFAKKHLKWYTNKGGKLIDPLNCIVLN